MLDVLFIAGGFTAVLMLGLLILRSKLVIFWVAFTMAFIPVGYIRYFDIKAPINLSWVIFFGLIGLSLLTALFKVRKAYIPKSSLLIYALIFLGAILSMILNYTSFFSFIFSQRVYFMFFAYTVIFRLVLDKYDKDDLFGYMVNFGLISSIAAVFQRFVLVSALRIGSADMVTGLFNDDGSFLLYQLISMAIVFVYWFRNEHLPHLVISKPFAFFALFLTLALANNKAGLMMFLFVIALSAWKMGPKIVIRHLPKIFIGAIAFTIVFTIYESFHNEAYGGKNKGTYSENITSPEFWVGYLVGDGTDESRFAKGGSLKRFAAVIFAYELIQKSPSHYWFGRGPGTTPNTSFKGATDFLNRQYPGYRIGRTSMSFFIAETGILGMALGMLFIVSLFLWKPPGLRHEPKRFQIIRQVYLVVATIFLFYENFYFLPIWALLIVVMLYPTYPKKVKRENDSQKTIAKPELLRV